jgi:type I restriction enzyme S subunit
MQDSELGPIPKGWRVGKVGEVVAVQNGYAFKSNDFKDAGEIKIIKIKNISGNLVDVVSTQFVDSEIVEKLDKKFKIESGSLLIAMTGAEVGKIGLVPNSEKPLWLNQRVGMFVEKVKYANHFFYILLGSEEYQNTLQNSALGSAQPNISSSVIENISTIMPPVKVILNFGELVNPLFERILSNIDESATLTAIRDSLLPKLMNGEIEV